jgi:DNA-binding phage protein
MPLKLTKFSVTDHLKTPEKQIAYIEAALDEGNPILETVNKALKVLGLKLSLAKAA